MKWEDEELTNKIINCCVTVHKTLGSGFLEIIYHNALKIELTKQGLMYETEKEVIITYDDIKVGKHRIDLLIEGKVVIELKAVDELSNKYYAQVRSYLNALSLGTGLLVNFSMPTVDVRRVQPKRMGR